MLTVLLVLVFEMQSVRSVLRRHRLPLSSVTDIFSKLLHYAAVVPVLMFGNDTSTELQTSLKMAPAIIRLLPEVCRQENTERTRKITN